MNDSKTGPSLSGAEGTIDQLAVLGESPLPRTKGERLLVAALKLARKITVPMYRVRRLAGLAERMRCAIGPIPLRVEVNDFDGTLTTDLDLASELGSRSFWSGYYERWEIGLLKRLLRPGDVFVDCGANTGEFTLVAAKAVGTRGHVVAFEPQFHLAVRLRRIVAQNGLRNVTVDDRGLGERSWRAKLAIPNHRQSHSGFPLREAIARVVGEGMTGFGADLACKYLPVDIIALDEAYPNLVPSVIKIDVEGSELAVLRGAEQMITKHKPILMLEINAMTAQAAGFTVSDLITWLAGHGYLMFTVCVRGHLFLRSHLLPFSLDSYEKITQQSPNATENVLCFSINDSRRMMLDL